MSEQKPVKSNQTMIVGGIRNRPRPTFIVTMLVIVFGLATVGYKYFHYTAAGSCNGISIAPGANIQSAVDAHSSNTVFCLASGTYRNQTVRPKVGDVFIGAGQDKTILNGSNLITSFGKSGNYWYAGNQTQELGAAGYCDDAYPACTEPVLLYFDNVPFVATKSLSAVTAGKFYFDHAANRVYFANDPTGHKVEVGATSIAFDGQRPGLGPKGAGGAVDVVIRDLTVEKYAQPAQHGAIETNNGWLIQKVTSQLNSGQGITLLGNNPHVTYSKFLKNGQIGIGANGGDGIDNDYGHAVYPVTVDNTEIAYNNYSHFNYGWEAGGTKFWETKGANINHNWVHHNIGPGLWDDGFNENIVFDANLVEDNEQNGIFHEISGKAQITNNLIQRNGGTNGSLGGGNAIQASQGAISISSGKDVSIAFNYIYNNGRGILLIDDPHYPDPTKNITVKANVIRQSGDQAIAASIPAYTKQGGSLKDFDIDYNQYTSAEAFGYDGAARSWSEWRAYGKDKNGGQNGNNYPVLTTAGIRPETEAAPSVNVYVPSLYSTVKGTATIRANASDVTGVTKVEFYIDDKLIATDKTDKYLANWSTKKYANGWHTITAKAYDADGHSTTSNKIGVTVKN